MSSSELALQLTLKAIDSGLICDPGYAKDTNMTARDAIAEKNSRNAVEVADFFLTIVDKIEKYYSE